MARPIKGTITEYPIEEDDNGDEIYRLRKTAIDALNQLVTIHGAHRFEFREAGIVEKAAKYLEAHWRKEKGGIS